MVILTYEIGFDRFRRVQLINWKIGCCVCVSDFDFVLFFSIIISFD